MLRPRFQRLVALFLGVLPRLGPRGGTIGPCAFRNTNIIGYSGVLPLQFRNVLTTVAPPQSPPLQTPKALRGLVFSPMIRFHSAALRFLPILPARHAIVALFSA